MMRNFMAGNFLAGDFLAHAVTFGDLMAGNIVSGDFLTRILSWYVYILFAVLYEEIDRLNRASNILYELM